MTFSDFHIFKKLSLLIEQYMPEFNENIFVC